MCARSKLPKFHKLWADCKHEESRLADQQSTLIVNEEEALTAKKNKRNSFRKNNKEGNSVRVPDKKKDVSKIRCYNYQSWDTFLMTILKEKGKESIKHMWQRKMNLLPQIKI